MPGRTSISTVNARRLQPAAVGQTLVEQGIVLRQQQQGGCHAGEVRRMERGEAPVAAVGGIGLVRRQNHASDAASKQVALRRSAAREAWSPAASVTG